ncbi:MAG: multidrug effflux MFS transporter [Anaerolineales bacterium]|nr:multidrug effflux MFS transporter [Anaerolineales bacterium]MCB0006355.1 multidrug effflux MFS transporter [Anaerolineales bacterium]MCB0011894.1 multidrug effflux MFS transporter [Anaerolineales bacterium]MCB0020681.1 multidrug effflux MFS transporter [Anaerolineales bacterium]
MSQAHSSSTAAEKQLPFTEFVALMASLTALVAVSIDGMLPALPAIGADLGVLDPNDSQLVVSYLLLGLGFGQLLFGPLSDSIGRKPAIYGGLVLFIGGATLAMLAPSFQWMLAGRLLQGLGAAGPRGVSMALIRDRFKGDAMARVMSFIMGVFILVPIVAPSLGQGILHFASWQAVFGMFILLAILAGSWFALRQPETLTPERRIPLQPARIMAGFRTVLSNRVVLGYTLAAGVISGAFVGYLSSSQQIFQTTFAVGDSFPIYFGALSAGSGLASFTNARLVMRFGMQWLTTMSARALTGMSAVFLLIALLLDRQPPFWLALVYLFAMFFCIGILFGNMNSLAMEPLGHVAGTGAAVVGSLSTIISSQLGAMVGQAYDGTMVPLVTGFVVLGLGNLLLMWWAETGRKTLPAV